MPSRAAAREDAAPEGTTDVYDTIIIGAGILGLATAYRLLEAKPEARLIVLDKEDGVARHQSGHNSGVIHAGVYYKPGSLKARLCKAGVEATIGFCQRHNVPYEQCGKLIVATDAVEVERLAGLEERVRANGLDYRRVEGDELRELEPNIAGEAGLLVAKTGLADFAAMCERLADQITQWGADIRFGAAVTAIRETGSEVAVETTAGAFTGQALIACAGLQADRIALMAGLDPDFRTIPFRGEYYKIADRRGALVRRHIYPVPDPALPFLGVHLTRMIGGYLTVGPNAVLSFGRETYDGNKPVARDLRDMARFPGFWKLLARNARSGVYEMRGSLFKRVYLERCRKYCPSLELDDLEPYRPGIRAQNVSRDGALIDDFRFLQTARSLHVCNAPSPAATSSLPIADEIVSRALNGKA